MSERSRLHISRHPRPLPAALLAVGALLAGACGGQQADTVRPSPSAPGTPSEVRATGDPTREVTSKATEDPAVGASPSPSAARPAAPPRCTRDHLEMSLGRIDAGAGNRYVPLVFTNTGATACALRGAPGVSLLDSAGKRIGDPAERSGPILPAVVLAPDGSAFASLHTVAEGVTDKPCRRAADRIQAYPPGSTHVLTTSADSFRVCGETFDVTAVKPGRHP